MLTYVVGTAAPAIKTLEDVLKLLPITSRVTAALPGTALDGERRLSCGTGLFTVNVSAEEAMPPGFVTVTIGVPATAIAFAGILACNSATLENVVDIVFPLKLTTEPVVKLLPDKVNVNDGAPAVALAGDSAPTTGWKFEPTTVNGNAGVAPPPGLGFFTETLSVPPRARSLAGSVVWRSVALT